MVKPEPARISRQTQAPRKAAKDRGEGGVIRGLIYLINGLIETSPIQNEGSQSVLHLSYLDKFGLRVTVEAGQALACLYSEARQ
jgi:hypothetical protein